MAKNCYGQQQGLKGSIIWKRNSIARKCEKDIAAKGRNFKKSQKNFIINCLGNSTDTWIKKEAF